MQTIYRTKVAVWQAARPPPVLSTTSEDMLVQPTYPLWPLVGQFHRCMTMMLVTSVVVSAMVWLGMRIIFPTIHHFDDLSGYEALMPGETTNPEDYSFRLVTHASGLPQTKNTYMNSLYISEVVIIEIAYEHEQIVRFTLYSNKIRLVDLLWRWGRPTYTHKDTTSKHWDLEWHKDHYTVSIECRTPNICCSVKSVRIALNHLDEQIK